VKRQEYRLLTVSPACLRSNPDQARMEHPVIIVVDNREEPVAIVEVAREAAAVVPEAAVAEEDNHFSSGISEALISLTTA
jgi:hypothetical protein